MNGCRRERNTPAPFGLGMRGSTLMQLLTAMSIMAALAAIAVPRFDSRRMQILTAHRLVISNLRVARANSISKSVHFTVSFPSNNVITVQRLKESPANSGTWVTDDTYTAQSITLPSTTTMKTAAVGTSVEFNSRGLAVNLAAARQLDVQDSYGVTKSLQVWPSGQVNEL